MPWPSRVLAQPEWQGYSTEAICSLSQVGHNLNKLLGITNIE